MFCRQCGEENPDDAVFCRNCGVKLKEEAKKAEVIDTPVSNNQNNNTYQNTTTESSQGNSMNWIACCCVGLFLVFIISGLFSGF